MSGRMARDQPKSDTLNFLRTQNHRYTVAFDDTIRDVWETFQATTVRGEWLLSSSQYRLEEPSLSSGCECRVSSLPIDESGAAQDPLVESHWNGSKAYWTGSRSV